MRRRRWPLRRITRRPPRKKHEPSRLSRRSGRSTLVPRERRFSDALRLTGLLPLHSLAIAHGIFDLQALRMRTSRERKAGQQTLDSRAAFRAQEDNETTVLRETGATGLEPATSGPPTGSRPNFERCSEPSFLLALCTAFLFARRRSSRAF